MSERSVLVYSQPDCVGCENVKGYLSSLGVPFVEKDITADPQAHAEFIRLGRPATPVTLIGEAVVWGFNRRALARALGVAATDGRG